MWANERTTSSEGAKRLGRLRLVYFLIFFESFFFKKKCLDAFTVLFEDVAVLNCFGVEPLGDLQALSAQAPELEPQ